MNAAVTPEANAPASDIYSKCAAKLLHQLERNTPAQPEDFVRIAAAVMRQEIGVESELLQRMRRIETKIHKIGVHVGAEPDTTMTPTRAVIAEEHRDRVIVYVPGYDVTLAQVKRAVVGEALAKTLYIVQDETLLGTLRLTNRE